jgi:predicted nucleotidyltransferase
MAALKDRYDLLQSPGVELLFVTIGGSHAFGFDSPDSDYDLRGAHVAPTRDLLSLKPATPQTWEADTFGVPCPEEIVSHEIGKFIMLMIKSGGNLIEHVLSPHVVYVGDRDFFDELTAIAPRAIIKPHLMHYLGFARSQIGLMRRRPDKEAKIFLYIFRTLMSGIWMARHGIAEPCLPLLNRELFQFDFIERLIEHKRTTREEGKLPNDLSSELLWRYIATVEEMLKGEIERSPLPEKTPDAVLSELDRILIDLRMRHLPVDRLRA